MFASHTGWWVFDTETDGLEVRGPDSRDTAWYAGFNPLGTSTVYCFDIYHQPGLWKQVKSLVEGLDLIGHNARFDIHALNLNHTGKLRDTMVVQYRLNTAGQKSLDYLAPRVGWRKIPTPDLLKGKKDEQNQIRRIPRADIGLYMADDILLTGYLVTNYRKERHFLEAEAAQDFRLEQVVQRMEARGVKLLLEPLAALAEELAPLVSQNETVVRAGGFDGNLNSPQQLKAWLIEKGYEKKFTVKLWDKPQRRKVMKFSTDAKQVLTPYLNSNNDPLIYALMMWRKFNKKKRDFCERLPDFITAEGLIYGQFKTTRTTTRRFAHATPNLGQIPKQGVTDQERRLAKAFRSCFTGESDWYTGADYSQVELRVAAALSQDERLLEAFDKGEDPHSTTAAATSGAPINNLPDGERFRAKATNFGILNGMRAPRLALQINTSTSVAQRFIDKHKLAHPQLHAWMYEVTEEANSQRVIEMVDGAMVALSPEGGVNNAVSHWVQGAAAQLMRVALVAADDAGLRPILTVHDELGCDIKDKGDELAEVMREAANSAMPELLGSVDFKAEGGCGRTWADA